VDRYGVPVFIAMKMSNTFVAQRGVFQNFMCFEALNFCKDLLGKFGGHKSSWGFSLPALNFGRLAIAPEHLTSALNTKTAAKD